MINFFAKVKHHPFLRYLRNYFKENIVLENVNNKKGLNKRVLISYVTSPFTNFNDLKDTHSLVNELIIISNVFDHLGFYVDITNYYSFKDFSLKKYDIIFGFGSPIEKAIKNRNTLNTPKVIYYSTGANPLYNLQISSQRTKEFNNKYESDFLPDRVDNCIQPLQLSFSDGYIILGNKWTISTYNMFNLTRKFQLNATPLKRKKNYQISSSKFYTPNKFLWFNSIGKVHKGLDLCLEFFSQRDEFELHICGPIDLKFSRIMEKYYLKPNIFEHGLIDINSNEFEKLINSCVFSILPSCSEGQSTSLLTTMSYGLIPVASKFVGLDIENLGYIIKELNIFEIAKTLNEIEFHNPQELENLSKKNVDYISSMHNLDKFKLDFEEIIVQILA